jgi:hypothetical protein
MAFNSSLAIFLQFLDLTTLLIFGSAGEERDKLPEFVVILTFLHLLNSILYLGEGGVHRICGLFPFHLFSLTTYKKPASQPTIKPTITLPLHVPPQNCTLELVIYHSILLQPCFLLVSEWWWCSNNVMIHVKKQSTNQFLGEIF